MLPLLIACVLSGCDEGSREGPAAGPPIIPAPPTERGQPPLEFAASAGFTYSAEELTPGFPGVLTIDLGPRLRVYAVTRRVAPATLTLLGADGRERQTFRIDLPVGGTIRAPAGLVGPDVDSFRLSARPQGIADSSHPELDSTTVVATTEGSLQPDFGVVKIWAVPAMRAGSVAGVPADFQEVYSGSFVADQWMGQGSPPDDQWLSSRVKASLTEVTTRPTAPAPPPGPAQ